MAKVIRIQTVPGVTGGRFCRAGRCFGPVPTELREDELTAEQLAALQAEPMLLVESAEVPEPTPPQAKAEAEAKAAKPQDEPKKADPAKPEPAKPEPAKPAAKAKEKK